MNVLHAPKNVGSHASGLASAENEARRLDGVPGRSWSVNFSPNPAVAPTDEDLPLRARAERGLTGKITYALGPLRYGLRHARDFDHLHLYFGESLFSFSRRFNRIEMLDLPFWKATGKRLFMTFQGCDARLKTVRAVAPVAACRTGFCDYAPCDAGLDARRRVMIERVRRSCRKTFCLNPDLLPFVEGAEFLPYASLELSLLEPPLAAAEPASNPVPIVVHAPTNRSIKGTDWVVRASEAVQRACAHRLVMIEGRSREQALSVYRQADVVVDQVLVGWYGGVALEAMALGRPVVAYLADECRRAIPKPMSDELPVVSATPDTLAAVLERLLASPHERATLGHRGREFVRRWHHPLKIARAMLQLYEKPSLRFWDRYDPEPSVPATPAAHP